MKTQDRTKCVSDGMSYLSNPTQSKCVNCGKYWVMGESTPDCMKHRTIRDVKKTIVAVPQGYNYFEVLHVGEIKTRAIKNIPNGATIKKMYLDELLKQPEKQEIEITEIKKIYENNLSMPKNWEFRLKNKLNEVIEVVNKLVNERT